MRHNTIILHCLQYIELLPNHSVITEVMLLEALHDFVNCLVIIIDIIFIIGMNKRKTTSLLL